VGITGWASSSDVAGYIADSRALVLPSFAEGLPVVIMEAFALKRPVISTYVAGIPELVENGVNGWLVPAGSAEALADAMRQALAASPEKLARMGRAGYERVTQNHDIRKEAAKLADLYREAIAEEKGEKAVETVARNTAPVRC
jgi:glycosyltransferase involved in cell wall biosynthesis